MAGSHLAALGVPAAVTALLPPNCISWLESALNAGGHIHQVKVCIKFSAAFRAVMSLPDFRALARFTRVCPSLLAQITLFHAM